jgi:hypothetical protein
MSDVILYTTEDGKTRIDLRVEGGTVWLHQLEIAELFQTSKQNVSLHVRNILKDGELDESATVKKSLTVQIPRFRMLSPVVKESLTTHRSNSRWTRLEIYCKDAA